MAIVETQLKIQEWLRSHGIDPVTVLVDDFDETGYSRILPSDGSAFTKTPRLVFERVEWESGVWDDEIEKLINEYQMHELLRDLKSGKVKLEFPAEEQTEEEN